LLSKIVGNERVSLTYLSNNSRCHCQLE